MLTDAGVDALLPTMSAVDVSAEQLGTLPNLPPDVPATRDAAGNFVFSERQLIAFARECTAAGALAILDGRHLEEPVPLDAGTLAT